MAQLSLRHAIRPLNVGERHPTPQGLHLDFAAGNALVELNEPLDDRFTSKVYGATDSILAPAIDEPRCA